MKIFCILFVCFISNIFSQSIMHPNQFGFGYQYSQSLNEKYNINGHTLYVSSGSFDFFYGYTKSVVMTDKPLSYETEDEFNAYIMGISLVSLKEGRNLMPSFSFFVGGIKDAFCVGLGSTVAYKLYDQDHIRIVPEAGATITFFDIAEKEIIGEAEVAFGFSLDMAIVTDYFILGIAPGYNAGEGVSFFSFGIGLSITPFKGNTDE